MVGNKAAILVLVLDLLKGVAAVLLAQALLPQLPWVAIGAAFLSLVGHSKSVFIGFTGGKAAATGLGTMVALMPLLSTVLAGVAIAVFLMTRTVSVASLTVAALTPPLLLWWRAPLPCLIYGCMAAIFVAVLHKDNIVRLLAGKENRLL
jgi:glycerol-3-phosphate acyltransferase PlsY